MDYKKLYDQVYTIAPTYGDFNHGRGAVEFVRFYNFRSIIELGCGSGEWLRTVDPPQGVGVDVSSPGADLTLDITRGLPFDDDSFDLVAAFDVLEHIGFDDMISVLFEIRRIAPRAIVSIGYGPSGHKHPGVDELHRTIMDQKQWIKVIKDSGMIFNRIIPPKYLCFGEW